MLASKTSLLVYSSVDKRTEYSRGYGTDAIRIVICKDNSHFLHKKLNRSNQVISNLKKEIEKDTRFSESPIYSPHKRISLIYAQQ
jgi:hypothetical protein